MKMLSLIIATLFALCLTTTVLAGIEPSPFQPEINQLGAVVNIISAADFRTVKTTAVPPEPCHPPEPCKDLIGDINKLAAIERQVSSLNDMITSMIDEVMGFEPLLSRGKAVQIVVVAIARELVAFVWDIARRIPAVA